MELSQHGLTESEARELLHRYGRNILPRKKPVTTIVLLWEQVKSPLIYILLVAAVVSYLLNDFRDALVILAAVLINTLLGFYQERKAQRSLSLLRSLITARARVIRSGKQVTIGAETLVPGDCVLLSAGEQIAADGYVIRATNLRINEAVLTGESMAVIKEVAKSRDEAKSTTKVFMGSTVVGGRGLFIVNATGNATEFGKIAVQLAHTHEEKTPLQKKIGQFAQFLLYFIGAVAIVIFVVGVLLGQSATVMFTTSVAIVVAAIPEGMAVSLTVILAIGMQRILKRKALVRKLLAAEALGSTTVIATDKTGTLTSGIMAVVKTKFIDEKLAFKTMILSNDREDSLDFAIWEYAEKIKLNPEKVFEEYERIEELPFDAVNKFTAAVYREGQSEVVYIKGAPEELVRRSSMSVGEKEKWFKILDDWGNEGLRIVGLANKNIVKDGSKKALLAQIHTLKFLGLLGIADPVRESVKESFARARDAGIAIKVVTGDYTATSVAILKKLGISLGKSEVVEGDMIEKMSEEDLEQRIESTVLFSRVNPLQKLRIVTTLQRQGEVVALVGDGVNDAPALKAADIGIVVGTATDVAKETADMVLLDSNFGTIIAAIEEGRGIYQNIRKVILYLLSGSFSEVILVLGALALGLPIPITASQILWINMVSDSLPNLALTVEAKGHNLLKDKPVDPSSQFLDGTTKTFITVVSATVGILLLIVFICIYRMTEDIVYSRSVVFMGLGMVSLLYVFPLRNINVPLFKTQLFSNIWLVLAVVAGVVVQAIPLFSHFLGGFLEIRKVDFFGWMAILAVVVAVFVVIESVKIYLARRRA